MKVTDRISAILRRKGSDIWSIPPDASVYSAIETMADRHVGALLVIDDGHLVGIVSERDYARKVILMGRSSKDTFVREIMTPSPVTVCLECCVDDAMRTMTMHKIRHLPVVDQDKVVGMLSIGDIVNFIIWSQDQAIEHLEHYITGQYPC
jgi:CBS domain-containing protein